MIADVYNAFLPSKRFSIVAYICLITHLLFGFIFSIVTAVWDANENGKFSCSVDAKSTATYKKQVDQACLAKYDQAYNSPVALYGFVLLSTGFTILVSVIYSLIVRTRVDEIVSRPERQTDGEAVMKIVDKTRNKNRGQNKRTVYVLYFYFVHLVLRMLLGIILIVLQYTYFYPSGFDSKFSCSFLPTEVTSNINTPQNESHNSNRTLVTCENAAASEKWLWGIFVSVINSVVALVTFLEVIYLLPRLPILNRHYEVGSWTRDTQFVTTFFLRNQVAIAPYNNNLQEYIHFYKEQVLNRSRAPDISCGPKACLDDLYIDVVIHTGRAQHEFLKEMDRHEIYDVYMEVPVTSIRLEKIKDLFRTNADTKGNFPRSILAIGRPGIGKTVLTEKILRDWANGVDEYYYDKIALLFKFSWFNNNNNKLENISLKKFLCFGTGLSDEKCESIYEEITKHPQKAILIFDGLDEYHGDLINCLDQSRIILNDPDICMSAMKLFVKLVLGDLLKGATVVVTSRPTADDFYSRLDFDRNVEIIGFTSDKIEEYVKRFCDHNNTSDLKMKLLNHIKCSSELLNLCHIPGNCFIVCATLSGCLSDPINETGALPTLTELFQTTVDHFEKYHHRNTDINPMTEETLKELQQLAFCGMENGQLIFDEELFDEQMTKSCLLNSLSNPIFRLEKQFCFIHLTIQEFLAARHVTETFAPPEIKKFISDHVESGRWHLVLQFIAGHLGKKIKNFDRKYKDCIFAFAEGLEVTNCKIEATYFEVFIMKCLKEAGDEEITKEVCKTTAINDLVELRTSTLYNLSSSEWAAVNFVCKHMTKLANLTLLQFAVDCCPEVLGLLRKRCLNKLEIEGVSHSEVFSALMELNCKLDHKHTKLTSLTVKISPQSRLPTMRNFIENGHASQLEQLTLPSNEIDPHQISKLCEVFNNGHCPNLTHLNLRNNSLYDVGARVLCDTLTKELCKLNTLDVSACKLTDRCISTLVKALQDERCQLTDLSLKMNAIGDEGACMLFEDALTKKHCKLTRLCLDKCSLTDHCIPSLCTGLEDEHCKLTKLWLGANNFTENGRKLLHDITNYKSCKARDLQIEVSMDQ
ncbi:NACHT, LRR and PYD domains-containing 14-like, partial [Paramuricea clavata]